VTVISDAYLGPAPWNGFMTGGFDGVMMDIHYYGAYQEPANLTWDQQIAEACGQANVIREYDLWTVVGEWSLAVTDCLNEVYLPPYGGSRYDGTLPGFPYLGSCQPYLAPGTDYSSDYKVFLRKFFEAQTSGECIPSSFWMLRALG